VHPTGIHVPHILKKQTMSKLKLRTPNRMKLIVAKTGNSRTEVFIKDYTGDKPRRYENGNNNGHSAIP
jgi:hypothetical protein